MLQNDLHKLYKLAETINIKFNANKFELFLHILNPQILQIQPTNNMMIQILTTKNKSEI